MLSSPPPILGSSFSGVLSWIWLASEEPPSSPALAFSTFSYTSSKLSAVISTDYVIAVGVITFCFYAYSNPSKSSFFDTSFISNSSVDYALVTKVCFYDELDCLLLDRERVAVWGAGF